MSAQKGWYKKGINFEKMLSFFVIRFKMSKIKEGIEFF